MESFLDDLENYSAVPCHYWNSDHPCLKFPPIQRGAAQRKAGSLGGGWTRQLLVPQWYHPTRRTLDRVVAKEIDASGCFASKLPKIRVPRQHSSTVREVTWQEQENPTTACHAAGEWSEFVKECFEKPSPSTLSGRPRQQNKVLDRETLAHTHIHTHTSTTKRNTIYRQGRDHKSGGQPFHDPIDPAALHSFRVKTEDFFPKHPTANKKSPQERM